MEPNHYVRVLIAYFYIPVALVVAGLGGVYTYHHYFGGQEAQATVAVLDPLTSRPAGYQQAQVTFDTVMKTRELDQRVGADVSRPPDWVAGHLTVSVVTTLAGLNVSPLYAVRGTAPTQADALQLTNAAVQEGRKLYIELNTPDPADIAAALAPQIKSAQQETDAARAALDEFELKNDAVDLPTRIAKERDLISTLQIAYFQAEADVAAYTATGSSVSYAAAKRRADSLGARLNTENAALANLVSLEDQYSQLTLSLSLAQGNLVSLQQLQEGEINGQQVPLTGDIKVVDGAQIQSQLLWYLLTYSVGIILGLLIAASVIYVIAMARKEPQTAESVSTAFGAPILARVPKAKAAAGGA